MKIQQAPSDLSPITHIRKVYITETCAAKTHSHSETIATLGPNAYALLFSFFFCLILQGDMQA